QNKSRLIVIDGPRTNQKLLCDGDLQVVDEVPVPERLEQRVGEAKHENVLDGFLAEVVVDAVDLALVELGVDEAVQFPSRGQVVAEGLFDDEAFPAAVVAIQTGLAEPLDD